jgi:hypothetical protein
MRMKKELISLGIAIALLLSAAIVRAQDEAQAPSFKNGDFWQFKVTVSNKSVGSSSNLLDDGTYEVSFSSGQFGVFKLNGDQKEELAKNQTGGILSLIGRTSNRDLKFPLTVGQKWDYRYERAAVGARKSFESHVTIEVSGTEQMTTGAGTLRTFKLEKDDRSGPKSFWTTVSYYSPETKSFVKQLFDSQSGTGVGYMREIELLKFGNGLAK